ncbi:DUF711 family protein [Candidatus Woesebacteria bacterium]|nr:DUF711 family protein [Candidatus Woesebacteria bacterium]
MSSNKYIRSICYFSDNPTAELKDKLDQLSKKLEDKKYVVQTKRICTSGIGAKELDGIFNDPSLYLSLGSLSLNEAQNRLDGVLNTPNTLFNIDLTHEKIEQEHVGILFDIIKSNASKTFNFTYVFNNAPSSPFMPSASYERNGFSIGLQATDLADGCSSISEWLDASKSAWEEITEMFQNDPDFLGIDSSVAPLFEGKSSFINFLRRLGFDFPQSTTTAIYTEITKYLKEQNPKPVGLCGLMFPCLEDFELAEEYEKGEFSLERNIYLSLHSGLGIDTYPIGIDENPMRVVGILTLLQNLSNKYKKPLSCRFVSDGKAKIGDNTDFQNQYLKDVVVRGL